MSKSNDREESKENPFSFRNFLTNQSASAASSSQRHNNPPRNRFQNSPEVENIEGRIPDNDTPKPKRRENTEPGADRDSNPYSFKRFLQQDNVRPVQSVRGDDNCMLVHGDLPDFVQDHFASSAGACANSLDAPGAIGGADDDVPLCSTSHHHTSVPLPDFDLNGAAHDRLSPPVSPNASRHHPVSSFSRRRLSTDLLSTQSSSTSDLGGVGEGDSSVENDDDDENDSLDSESALANGGGVRNGGVGSDNVAGRANGDGAEVPRGSTVGGRGMGSGVSAGSNGPSLATANGSSRVLPDFLSDSGVSRLPTLINGDIGIGSGIPPVGLPPLSQSNEASNMNISHDIQLERLRRENHILDRDLRLAQSEIRDKDAQMERLRARLREKDNSEADETATMERILKQVENNLKTATERATKSEAQVKKLKDEVRSLRDQLGASACPSCSGHAAGVSSDSAAVRTRELGVQLGQSAAEAEVMLRQLLAGVRQVKLVSESLQSLDKFSDASPQK